MLNCGLGEWPMKYLGIPVSPSRLGIADLRGLGDKMKKKLDPWKGKHLSSRGRLILTNSSLTSLPMYMMGFYLLPKEINDEMDKYRSNFFWQGASDDFKYHMAKMDTLCRPKNQGGVGMGVAMVFTFQRATCYELTVQKHIGCLYVKLFLIALI